MAGRVVQGGLLFSAWRARGHNTNIGCGCASSAWSPGQLCVRWTCWRNHPRHRCEYVPPERQLLALPDDFVEQAAAAALVFQTVELPHTGQCAPGDVLVVAPRGVNTAASKSRTGRLPLFVVAPTRASWPGRNRWARILIDR